MTSGAGLAVAAASASAASWPSSSGSSSAAAASTAGGASATAASAASAAAAARSSRICQNGLLRWTCAPGRGVLIVGAATTASGFFTERGAATAALCSGLQRNTSLSKASATASSTAVASAGSSSTTISTVDGDVERRSSRSNGVLPTPAPTTALRPPPLLPLLLPLAPLLLRLPWLLRERGSFVIASSYR